MVDCPPAPEVDFTVDCPCAGRITATVRDHDVSRCQQVITVEVPGRAARSVTVAPGTTGALTGVTWARGQTVVVWNQHRLAGAAHGARVKVTSLTVG